jgi:hypothetical protein
LQVEVPLQVRVAQTSLVQVMGVPPSQTPPAVHLSVYVHASPSSQV